MSDEYKCTYSFHVEYENVDLPGEPRHSVTVQSFDGTDVHINVVVQQFVTFLKAAGYNFYDLEVIKDANSYKI